MMELDDNFLFTFGALHWAPPAEAVIISGKIQGVLQQVRSTS